MGEHRLGARLHPRRAGAEPQPAHERPGGEDRPKEELIFGSEHGRTLVASARTRIAPLVEELVRRAQASGDVRADLATTDVGLLQFMLTSIAELAGDEAPDLWRRYLGIVLDGLRPGTARRLPVPPLDLSEFETLLGRRRR